MKSHASALVTHVSFYVIMCFKRYLSDLMNPMLNFETVLINIYTSMQTGHPIVNNMDIFVHIKILIHTVEYF